MAGLPELVTTAGNVSETLWSGLRRGLMTPHQYASVVRESFIFPLAVYYIDGFGPPVTDNKFSWKPPVEPTEALETTLVHLTALTSASFSCHRVFRATMNSDDGMDDIKYGVACLHMGKKFCETMHRIVDCKVYDPVRDELGKSAVYFDALFALELAKIMKDKESVREAVALCRVLGDGEMLEEATQISREIGGW